MADQARRAFRGQDSVSILRRKTFLDHELTGGEISQNRARVESCQKRRRHAMEGHGFRRQAGLVAMPLRARIPCLDLQSHARRHGLSGLLPIQENKAIDHVQATGNKSLVPVGLVVERTCVRTCAEGRPRSRNHTQSSCTTQPRHRPRQGVLFGPIRMITLVICVNEGTQ